MVGGDEMHIAAWAPVLVVIAPPRVLQNWGNQDRRIKTGHD